MSIFTIIIDDLEFEVIIGVLERERKQKQKVIVNAAIEYDRDRHFLNYVEVVEAISNLLKYKGYDTVENALEGICRALKEDFDEIVSIDLSIKKPEVFQNGVIGVKIYKIFD